jgi:uncharacterized protein
MVILGLLCSHIALAKTVSDPRLAIIIDDIGYRQIQSYRAARLAGNFTLAVLPFTPYGNEAAELAHRMGKELMLHLPMSNLANLSLGPGGLYSGMPKEKLVAVLRQDLNSLAYAKGVNNHMGSRLTQEGEPMIWVMEELRARGLYFIDSRTSPQTKALDIARAMQVRSAKRDVFLDDVDDVNEIKRALNRAIALAQEHGSAIAIGHPYPATLQVMEQLQPLLAEHGVRLVFAAQLLSPVLTDQKSTVVNPATISTGECSMPSYPLLEAIGDSVELLDIINKPESDNLVIKNDFPKHN